MRPLPLRSVCSSTTLKVNALQITSLRLSVLSRLQKRLSGCNETGGCRRVHLYYLRISSGMTDRQWHCQAPHNGLSVVPSMVPCRLLLLPPLYHNNSISPLEEADDVCGRSCNLNTLRRDSGKRIVKSIYFILKFFEEENLSSDFP